MFKWIKNKKQFFEQISGVEDEHFEFRCVALQDKDVIMLEQLIKEWNEQILYESNEKKRPLLFVLKQIARGNYYILNINECVIKMDKDILNADYVKLSRNSISTFDLLSMIKKIAFSEDPEKRILSTKHKKAIMEYMNFDGEDIDSIYDMDVIHFLYGHQKNTLAKGSEYSDLILAKLYFVEEPHTNINEKRKKKFASFIDYEKQFMQQDGKNEKIIYDERNTCGLWTFRASNIESYFSEGCYSQNEETMFEHYGTGLLLLKMFPDEEYYIGDKEIIGPKFFVVKKYDLLEEQDLINLDIDLNGKRGVFSNRMIHELRTFKGIEH